MNATTNKIKKHYSPAMWRDGTCVCHLNEGTVMINVLMYMVSSGLPCRIGVFESVVMVCWTLLHDVSSVHLSANIETTYQEPGRARMLKVGISL